LGQRRQIAHGSAPDEFTSSINEFFAFASPPLAGFTILGIETGGGNMRDLEIRTRKGATISLSASALSVLAGHVAGTLLLRGDAAYDIVRKVWNGMVDRRPALIARCAHSEDVVACVRFAREHELSVSVRGGGHNYGGTSVSDGGMMIDLSAMRAVSVDPAARVARAAAGLRLGALDAAAAKHGLATTLGVNTDTGIAGLTLGGGYGWLAGRFGLACDNLIGAEVVTADGGHLEVNQSENEDLLWGLRGAGANLGIVTRLDYRLHPLGLVMGGLVIYSMEHAHAALRLFDDFAATCPDEVSTVGLLLHTPDGAPAIAIGLCYAGPLDKVDAVLAPLLRSVPVLANVLEVQPYTKLQTLFDAVWPPGRLYYSKSAITRRLSDAAIDCLVTHGREMPTSLSAIAFQQLHGAAARIGVSETAFPHRFDHLSMYVHPATDDPAQASTIVDWGRRCWAAMQPFMESAVYVNGIEDLREEGSLRVREAYGANYDRLARLKALYDPSNFLSGNSNIAPLVERSY
jgi:FAD/FMN-containing dehydrogenase